MKPHHSFPLIATLRYGLIASILVIMSVVSASTYAANILDDSCTGTSLTTTEQTKLNALVEGLTGKQSMGLQKAAQILDNFRMTGFEGSACTSSVVIGQDGISIQDKDEYKAVFCYGSDSSNCQKAALKNGERVLIDNLWFQAIRDGSNLCIHIQTLNTWLKLGCRDISFVNKENQTANACYVSKSCTDNAKQYSKSWIPISAVIVQCVKETLEAIFQHPSQECTAYGNRTNLFPAFQDAMRRSIGAALMLYVIFFGFKVAQGKEIPKKGELFMTFLKMIIVIYFALGDGVRRDLYPMFLSGTSSLVNFIVNAGGSRGLCEYAANNYTAGYSYLSAFDALDCRIGFYLGMYNPTALSQAGAALVTAPLIFTIIVPLFTSFMLLPAIFAFIFGIFLLSAVVHVVHIFLISLIMLTILMYLSPIFITFMLFKPTKGDFDNWLRMCFGLALQPAFLFGVLALMFTIFDRMYYGDCQFKRISDSPLMFAIDTNFDNYPNGSGGDEALSCTESFGYKMDVFKSTDPIERVEATFFNVTQLKDSSYFEDSATGLMKLSLFAFLFYYFLLFAGNIAGDLSGSLPMSGYAVNPNKIADSAASKAKKLMDMGIGKIVGNRNKNSSGKKS